jgi:hypothetical protein
MKQIKAMAESKPQTKASLDDARMVTASEALASEPQAQPSLRVPVAEWVESDFRPQIQIIRYLSIHQFRTTGGTGVPTKSKPGQGRCILAKTLK